SRRGGSPAVIRIRFPGAEISGDESSPGSCAAHTAYASGGTSDCSPMGIPIGCAQYRSESKGKAGTVVHAKHALAFVQKPRSCPLIESTSTSGFSKLCPHKDKVGRSQVIN